MLQVRLSCMGCPGQRVSDDGSSTSEGSNFVDMATWIADSLQWPGWLMGRPCSILIATITAAVFATLVGALVSVQMASAMQDAVIHRVCAREAASRPWWLHASSAGLQCEGRLITV